MIQVAYDFPADRISGPDWFDSNCYDIVATVPLGASVADFRLMLQNLLAERFKLSVHRGVKQVSGYALEVAKGGPKLPKSKDAAATASAVLDQDTGKANPKRDEALQYMATRTPAFRAMVAIDKDGFPVPQPGNPIYPPGAAFGVTIAVNGSYRSTALNQDMPALATFLGNLAGARAEDRTGLTGKYDARLEYVVKTDEPGPGIFDAIEQQLGLKLAPAKVPVEILVVDHAEKIPAEN